jgi:hypothetical protein
MTNRTANWASRPRLYIGADAGDLKSVGFAFANETHEAGAIDTGFGLFGGWAFNNIKDGAIEMNFVATPTNETDVYQCVHSTGPIRDLTDVSQSEMECGGNESNRQRRTDLT